MSGCVNCVWDRFREDFEEWKTKKEEAEARMAATQAAEGTKEPKDAAPATTKDAKLAKNMWDEDAFQDVPVGIREFMKVEKQLREKNSSNGAPRP
jgi:predicted  nucleic acid-binding Zn-ribbon protein